MTDIELQELKSKWVSLSIQIDQTEERGEKRRLEIQLEIVFSQLVPAISRGDITVEELMALKQAQEQKMVKPVSQLP